MNCQTGIANNDFYNPYFLTLKFKQRHQKPYAYGSDGLKPIRAP